VQFSVYAMLAAPLIISQDLSKSTPFVLQTLTNKRVIAIDQVATERGEREESM